MPIASSRRAAVLTAFAAPLLLLATASVANGLWKPANGSKPALITHERMAVTVVKVKDGDTLQVRELLKDVRLASIDAPELGHGRARPGQAFAQTSRKALIDLVGNGRRIEAYCYERDQYERPVCDLFADGSSVGRSMVGAGMAWANQASGGRYLRDRQLVSLQEQARAQRQGLWGDQRPMEPWEWRKRCWKGGQCSVGWQVLQNGGDVLSRLNQTEAP